MSFRVQHGTLPNRPTATGDLSIMFPICNSLVHLRVSSGGMNIWSRDRIVPGVSENIKNSFFSE
jgi:hypothetical protein